MFLDEDTALLLIRYDGSKYEEGFNFAASDANLPMIPES